MSHRLPALPSPRPRNLLALPTILAAATLLVVAAARPSYAQPPSLESESDPEGTGWVFALTNEAAANRVAYFFRRPNGSLLPAGLVPTGGHGTGSVLDSQGARVLAAGNRRLYACNPGSDQISVFRVGLQTPPHLLQVISSGGDMPLSLTVHRDLVYVLNGGPAATNITGFRRDSDGTLQKLPGSTRMLSTPVGAPAQVQFNPEGTVLVVTHKATDVLHSPDNIIDTFTVGPDGLASEAMPQPSHGVRPFGFAFTLDGVAIVSEAFNGVPGRAAVSSYIVDRSGGLQVITGSLGNGQAASCWVALTRNGRLAYVANTPAGTLSSYAVSETGALTLLQGVAAATGTDSSPVDVDVDSSGQYLYVLLTGAGRVVTYRINDDATLTPIDSDGGVPPMGMAQGLAAF